MNSVKVIRTLGVVCTSLWISSHPAIAQELPPEPDMSDLLGEMDPELDMGVDPEAFEPPPLSTQDQETLVDPAEEMLLPEEGIDENYLNDMPELPAQDRDGFGELPSFDALEPPIENSAETVQEQMPTQVKRQPVGPIDANLTPQEKAQYRELKSALFEFLDKPLEEEQFVEQTPAQEPLPAALDDMGMPDELATSEPEILSPSDDAMADDLLGGMIDDALLDDVLSDQTIEQGTPQAPATQQPQQQATTQQQPQPQQETVTESVPDQTAAAQTPPKKKNNYKLPQEQKLPQMPALSAEEKEYLEQLEQQSESLPDFAQLSEAEKEALKKPLEELARAQKEQDVEKSMPPEKEELVRGGDLSAKPADESGQVRSESYDLSVSTDDKKDQFLSTDIQLEMAYRALLSGQLEAAIDIYKTVMEKHPENQTAMFGLASAYQKNNQHEQSKELYRELLAVSPNHKEALNNYLVLMTHEAPEDALLQLQKLERVSPYYSPIPAQIGMVYYRMGQYVQAERYLRKAISMSPDNLSYLYNLAIISDHLGKTDQSISLYERLIKESKKGQSIPGSIEHISERLHYLRSKAPM